VRDCLRTGLRIEYQTACDDAKGSSGTQMLVDVSKVDRAESQRLHVVAGARAVRRRTGRLTKPLNFGLRVRSIETEFV
jgi:hypothetical protein